MRCNLVSFLHVVLIAILLSQATGCSVIKGIFRDFLGIKSEKRVEEPRKEPQEVSKSRPPGAFNVQLKIRNWHVEDHRILDYDLRWGSFRHAGRFVYLDKLVFKFKSDRYPDHYWVAKIPEVKEGNYEIRAMRYEEPSRDLTPIEPPDQFTIILSISNEKVTNHMIKNPHPGWGDFIVDKYRQGVLYLKNPFYPKCLWAVRMPRNDGNWTIYAVLVKK